MLTVADKIHYRDLLRLDVDYARFNAHRTVSDFRPSEFRVERFGDLTATVDPARADQPYYNRVVGIRPDAVAQLTDALDMYNDIGIEPRVDLVSNSAPDAVEYLRDIEFHPIARLTYLVADPTAALITAKSASDSTPMPLPSPTRWTETAADRFLDLLQLQGGPIDAEMRDLRRPHFCTDTFRAYVVELDSEPVSWATMFVDGSTGFLGNAFTIPDARGRGCQTALLLTRLQDAADLGLEWVLCDGVPGGTSHRNCQRLGFRNVADLDHWVR